MSRRRQPAAPGARCGALALAAALALSCASTPDPKEAPAGDGIVHVLRAGENLYRLSRFYGVPVDTIARANRIDDPTRLSVGQRLWIPGASGRPGGALAAPNGSRGASRARPANLDFDWPVDARPTSRFGWRRGRRHEGIDIPAKRGTPIHAAEAGRVIHSGRGLGAYGEVVIVKHAGHYSTVYAHNAHNRVRKGDFVEKGEILGEVGTTGNATGPHVHFEVRRDSEPLDPLLFLQ